MTDANISFSFGGFSSLLTILFIALKLLDKIDWSWWWVLSPLWIGLGLFIAFFIIIGISMIIYAIITS